jgi:hypothetical protein
MAVREGDYKLVIHFGEKMDRMYDVKSDPEENSPLPIGVQTQERARLLRIALAHIQKLEQERNLDLRLRSRIRDLQQSMARFAQAAKV